MQILDGQSVIGGGSTPAEYLQTRLLVISARKYSAAQIEARLRTGDTVQAGQQMPVLARILEDRLVLDLRTVFPWQDESLTAALFATLT